MEFRTGEHVCNSKQANLVQRKERAWREAHNKNPLHILEAISIFASLIRPFPN
jgi:hypothetical protein